MELPTNRNKRNVFWALIIALSLEIITSISRFWLHIVSTRDTAFLAEYTFNIRIHHGYIGLIMLFVAYLNAKRPFSDLFYRIGGGLFLSDIVHHFLVLWLINGSPEFDLIYH